MSNTWKLYPPPPPPPQTPWKGIRAHRHSKGPSVCSPVFRISIGITWCGQRVADGVHRGWPWTCTAPPSTERGGRPDSPQGLPWAPAGGASSAPLVELEPVSFPAGLAVEGPNPDVHGKFQPGGPAGSRGEQSRAGHQSRGENACEG